MLESEIMERLQSEAMTRSWEWGLREEGTE